MGDRMEQNPDGESTSSPDKGRGETSEKMDDQENNNEGGRKRPTSDEKATRKCAFAAMGLCERSKCSMCAIAKAQAEVEDSKSKVDKGKPKATPNNAVDEYKPYSRTTNQTFMEEPQPSTSRGNVTEKSMETKPECSSQPSTSGYKPYSVKSDSIKDKLNRILNIGWTQTFKNNLESHTLNDIGSDEETDEENSEEINELIRLKNAMNKARANELRLEEAELRVEESSADCIQRMEGESEAHAQSTDTIGLELFGRAQATPSHGRDAIKTVHNEYRRPPASPNSQSSGNGSPDDSSEDQDAGPHVRPRPCPLSPNTVMFAPRMVPIRSWNSPHDWIGVTMYYWQNTMDVRNRITSLTHERRALLIEYMAFFKWAFNLLVKQHYNEANNRNKFECAFCPHNLLTVESRKEHEQCECLFPGAPNHDCDEICEQLAASLPGTPIVLEVNSDEFPNAPPDGNTENVYYEDAAINPENRIMFVPQIPHQVEEEDLEDDEDEDEDSDDHDEEDHNENEDDEDEQNEDEDDDDEDNLVPIAQLLHDIQGYEQ